jgi:hypothetical protein
VLYPRPPSGKKKSSRKGKNREWGNGGIWDLITCYRVS